MKKFTRILSAILIMAMVMSTVSFAATFSDVPSTAKYYEPVGILSAFGIINGYEDGTFGPEKDVTRAEFATMLMRALASSGYGSADPAGMPFTDLGAASWAISDIRTAYDLGIINGMTATTFEPNSNVTYEQALKMIVCALNYGAQAEQVQGAAPTQPWYYGYVQTAITLGLTSNISFVPQQPAKRWEIAQMIYNSFDVKLLEKVEITGGGVMYQQTSNTILNSKLNITKANGEIMADETDTISPDGATARAGSALIYDNASKETYSVAKNGIDISGLLGKTVDYYYKTDVYGEKTLVHVVSKGGSNSVVTIDAINLANITGTYESGFTVKYYASTATSRETILRTAANPVISINGEVYTDISADDLMIETGSLEFIETDGVYSKVNIEAYETYVVKSVNSTDYKIVDMYRQSGSNTLYLNEEDGNYIITMKNLSGNTVTFSNIGQYNVLSVKQGRGASNRITYDITVSNKNVSGAIKKIDINNRKLNIAGTDYELSQYFLNYGMSTLDTLSVGDNCRCYLDKDGKIAYIVKTASTTTFYGYLAGAAEVDEEIKIGVVSSKVPSVGSPYLTLASKVKIDGESYSDIDEILGVLKDAAKLDTANIDDGTGATYTQLIKYTVNTAGKVSAIETAVLGENESEDDESIFRSFEVERKSNNTMKYQSSSRDFIGKTNSDKFRISSSTQVFVVPSTRSEYESYSRRTYSYFKDGGSYIIEPYDVTGSLNIAGAVVVYVTDASTASVEHTTPLFIITDIGQGYSGENESDMVTGYEITPSAKATEKTVYTENVGVISDNYSIGDVIMYATNNKGNITNTDETLVHLISPTDFESVNRVIGGKRDTYECEVFSGLLLGSHIDDSTQMFDLALTDSVEDCATADTASFTANSSVKYFTYDSEATAKNRITLHEGAFDLAALASYNDTKDTDEPSAGKIFVYKYNNAVRMVYIIK